jgi:hypothetical protein
MNSTEIQQFIKENSALFWYIPEEKKPEISEELLVETILNYGDMEAVRKMFHLMGIQRVAAIFFRTVDLSERRKGNYHELILYYFTLVFKRYAN